MSLDHLFVPESILQMLYSIWMKVFHNFLQTLLHSHVLEVTLHCWNTQVCPLMCPCDCKPTA